MVHKFMAGSYKMAVDVESAAVHVLDDITYDLIDYGGPDMPPQPPESAINTLKSKYSPDLLNEAWSELYKLYSDGVLFSKNGYENYRNAGEKAPIKSMCLNIAHDCNLRCEYCFASTGDYSGGRSLMPFEVGKAAIDFILNSSANRRNLEIDFFGGEPLMNFDVVKQIVAYARDAEKKKNKNIRFTITTNALLLDDEKIDFINKEMSNVVLSIDGRKAVNDAVRKTVNGGGSYDIIIDNIKRLVEKRENKNYYVRGTFTRKNLDFADDVLHLADLGFDQVSVEPVMLSETSDLSLRQEDLPRIYSEYDKLTEEFIKRKKEGRGFNFFHFMMDLDEGPCLIKLLRGCGCGNEYVAVTPQGDIYPCHQYVGQDEFIMGNVMNNGEKLIAVELKSKFSKANILSKEGCNECWARFYCSGGCNANNSAYMGDMHKPLAISCEIEKKRVECALMIKAALI